MSVGVVTRGQTKPMKSAQSIEGLIKWARRDEWRDELSLQFDRHVGAACESAKIPIDELAGIIGEHWASALWGCAFEDLVSTTREGLNIAEDYLKRRGWKESAGTRAYIQALRHAVMSLYEVSDIVVGESFLARDLVRGGEPVRVFERSATRSLSQWDRIAARVVSVQGRTQISGGLLPFSPDLADRALASIERVRKRASKEAVRLAKSLGHDVSRAEFAAATGLNEVLAGSAFLFSNLWLKDALSRAMDPVVPAMQNTDGEPLEFLTLHFAIDSQAKIPAIRAALDGLSALHKESETFWNWLERRGSGPRATPKSAAVHTFGTTMDDGSVVLGNIELGEKALTLSANSEARAARGRALLESALAGLVRAPLVERQTVEQMMDSSRGKGMGQDSLDLSWDEQRRLVHRALTDHYRRTLDDPIPALGNVSPRKAARTARGRERVIAWLKKLENHSARRGSDDPMSSYDFAWMWAELGLSNGR